MQIPSSDGQNRQLHFQHGKPGSGNHSKSISQSAQQSHVGHTTDSQVSQLRSQFQGQQIRPEVVAAAKQDVASGALLSSESAQETANAILGIVKHF